MAPAFCNPLPRPPRTSRLLLEVRQGYSREQPSPMHQPDSFPEQVHPVRGTELGSCGEKNQHISMWFNTIKLRGFLTRGQTKEICKDKLSFDNPWLGHCHTGKKVAFITSRNKKFRHQTESHADTYQKNSIWVEIFRCTVQLLWESNSKLVANVKWFSAWKLAIGDDWKHSQGASTEIKDCLLNIQDLWTFQDKLLCLFSSSHILWPMLIQALVLLHSSLQHPCQVPPYPALQGFSSLLAQSLPGLASSATLSPWFPLLPSFPNINSHSPAESASPVHSLGHFGARTTLGSHTSHCPMGLLLALRHRGTNPASPSSSRSHSTHMPKTPCKICHFLKQLQFVSIWEFCSADKGKAVTQNLLFLPSAHH